LQNTKNTDLKEKLLEFINKHGIVDIWKYIEQEYDNDGEAIKQVNALLKSGHIIRMKNGKVASLKQAGYVRGVIEIKKSGFGFIRDEAGDVFVPESEMRGALNGEEVLAWAGKVTAKGREGKIEKVLSALPYRAVGRFLRNKKGRPYVLLEDHGDLKVMITNIKHIDAKNHDVVVVDIERRDMGKKPAEGKIIEVLGKETLPGVDILRIARSYGLYTEFPNAVMRQVDEIPDYVEKQELETRELLFDKKIFTIDGIDAKDLDDAVSLERTKKGNYLLGVHIADVSHYVQPGTALDREAFSRGTSVYLVDQVIPMLPKQLSNGICSLNENEVRLTMSCFMEINANGDIVKKRFANTAIRTCHRLNYDEINDLLENEDAQVKEKYSDIADVLYAMKELAAILKAKRDRDGNIDFDVPEAKIYLDQNKRPYQIQKRVQRTAENLIEEFMICCNNAVAQAFSDAKMPSIYRVHDRPDGEKLDSLNRLLSNFGYRKVNMTNRELQEILRECTDTPEENIVKTVALRSMKKAIYSQENRGHFGLGSEAYTHFTSPIRRYPDLIVHRLLKAYMGADSIAGHTLNAVATQSNMAERKAIEAERKVDDIKKAEYMSDHLGDIYTGRVSGVTAYGLYVELDNTVEGFLPMNWLRDDYYTYMEQYFCVVGRRTKRKISLGDSIEIQVVSADKSVPRIEFSDVQVHKSRNA